MLECVEHFQAAYVIFLYTEFRTKQIFVILIVFAKKSRLF